MYPMDAWRKSLASRLHVGENTKSDRHYLNLQGTSYRFECILCRWIRRGWQQPPPADWSDWVKERLQSAILELDAIFMRILASGTLLEYPMSLYVPSILPNLPMFRHARRTHSTTNNYHVSVTTITVLLALRIESALDPAETDLVRSMSRISISQEMLVLTQGKEIPVLKRALPIFEEILAKHDLYLVPPNNLRDASAQSQSNDNSMADAYASPHTHVTADSSHLEQSGMNPSFDVDFLGFDFLDEWQLGPPGFTDRF